MPGMCSNQFRGPFSEPQTLKKDLPRSDLRSNDEYPISGTPLPSQLNIVFYIRLQYQDTIVVPLLLNASYRIFEPQISCLKCLKSFDRNGLYLNALGRTTECLLWRLEPAFRTWQRSASAVNTGLKRFFDCLVCIIKKRSMS